MKTVVNIGIGGRCFTIDEDAYSKLNTYLNTFRTKSGVDSQTNEIMDEVELRIAELFAESISSSHREVVDITLVNEVIARIGMPDGSDPSDNESSSNDCENRREKSSRKLYRDPSNQKIAGVCSGLAAYFNIDVTLLRVIFLVSLIGALSGFWIYIILWFVIPKALTATQKCEMHGIPATAENIKKFTDSKL